MQLHRDEEPVGAGVGAARGWAAAVIARLAIGVVAITVVGSLLGRLLLGSSGSGILQPFDEAVRSWTNEHLHGLGTQGQLLAQYGSSVRILIASAALSAVLLLRMRDRARALIPFVAVVVAATTGLLTKILVARQRPVGEGEGLLERYALPSGHTIAAVSLATGAYLVWVHGREGWPRVVGATALAVVSLTVAGARVVVDAHWCTDVVAGAAMGVASALVARWALVGAGSGPVGARAAPET